MTRLMAGVGWRDQGRRISFYAHHPSCVGYVAEDGGRVVGASFGVANGRVGWIGLVCVSPGFRGRGLGEVLTKTVMDSLEGLGCLTLVLVATAMGEPLYERLGFEFVTNYHGYTGPGTDKKVEGFEAVSPGNIERVLRLDRSVTGENRRALLEAAPRGWMLPGPHGEARAHHFAAPWGGGPAIASDFEAGETVVDFQRGAAGSEGSVRVWLTDENERGRKHVESIGFEKFRVSPRMARGEAVEWRPEGLWGVFSLAKG